MKTILTAVFAFFTFVSVAAEPLEMELDIANEFAAIEQLENTIAQNPGLSLSEVKANHEYLLSGVSILEESSVSSISKDMPILPSFWWGCCLGIVGLVVVYLVTDNDKDQVKKALIGCVISTLIVGVGGILNPFGWF
jgi:hypothetical protein